MAEIDEVIEIHGGWPGAFQTAEPGEGAAQPLSRVAEAEAEYDAGKNPRMRKR